MSQWPFVRDPIASDVKINVKSSFPKGIKHHTKNQHCNANAKFGRALHKCVHIYTHIHIHEKLFTNKPFLELALTLKSHFLEWSITLFEKSSSCVLEASLNKAKFPFHYSMDLLCNIAWFNDLWIPSFIW